MAIYKRGSIYWYHFFYDGQHIQRSSGVSDAKEAAKIEKAAYVQFCRGEVGIEDKPKPERLTVNQLLDKVLADWTLRKKLSAPNLSNLARTRRDFGARWADALGEQDIHRYVAARQKSKAADASINRVLQILKRGYHLARIAPPPIVHLEENNAREGFFSRAEFDRLQGLLPADLRDFFLFAFLTGMRLKEIKSLKWASVQDHRIQLPGRDAKTKKSRFLPATGELAPLLERRRQARAFTDTDGNTVMASTIFHRSGEPVGEFRKCWQTACRKAELGKLVPAVDAAGKPIMTRPRTPDAKPKPKMVYEGKVFHDFRRSAIRNLIRSGISQAVAMQISGHRTVSVFNRYNITSEQDVENAFQTLEQQQQAERQKVVAIR